MTDQLNFINSLGLKVYSDNLSKIPAKGKKGYVVNTISPNSYGISTKDPIFHESLKQSDYLVLDGVYFALASIFLNGRNIKKNQGFDVFNHFMNRLNRESGKVFFLGSSTSTLKKITRKAKLDFPNIKVGYYSPPYKSEFTEDENRQMIEAINLFEPDVLFVGMTCPKQEKWAFQNKLYLKTSLICCIGAVFDWYAGNEKIIAPIWWKLRLAWLIRTINRPEILKRYPNIGIFFWHLILAILGNKKYKYGKF
jgi:N-acetylglucosaminyldiphosphoundecaprenol N-acetyl-beta-D-mannosaminyltransferase